MPVTAAPIASLPVELTARTSTIGSCPVVSLIGEIDMATLPQLHNVLTRAVFDNRAATVVVDLDGVFVCDDAGLGVLLGAAARARETNGDLVVVCSGGSLRARLISTGFDRAVTVVDSMAAAVSGGGIER